MGSPPTGRGLSAGRVIEVDSATGKVTIEHGPIAHLYMEAMTMIFRVKDSAMLTGLTFGDKIRFEVRRDNGGYIITKIENSN
ncbi:MAG: copper-binding protein [Rhodospirillales bacterium]|nr:copper-binding protein [Rhodospirillales bacterium]